MGGDDQNVLSTSLSHCCTVFQCFWASHIWALDNQRRDKEILRKQHDSVLLERVSLQKDLVKLKDQQASSKKKVHEYDTPSSLGVEFKLQKIM